MYIGAWRGSCLETTSACHWLFNRDNASKRQNVVVYRVTCAQSKVVHHGSNAPENMSAMTQHAIGYGTRKHRTAKAPKQVLACCWVQHTLSIAGISVPTFRALTTWHRNRSASVCRCLAGQLPGHHQCMSLAVQQGKRFETLECCSASHHSCADAGCASRIECTTKRVSNDSA